MDSPTPEQPIVFSEKESSLSSPIISASPRVGKFQASRMIVRASFELLKQDREMVWFPILSFLASCAAFFIGFVLFIVLVLGGSLAGLDQAMQSNNGMPPLGYVLIFLSYFASYFIILFFQAGIVAIVSGRLNGQDLTFFDGLRMASEHAGKIARWSLLSATVGMVLRMISDRSEWLGKLVAGLLGAVWNIVTFFIVPVLIFEEGSLGDALRSSGATVKKMWGEAIIINVGAGLVFLLLAAVGVLLFIISLFTGKAAVIVTAAVLLFLYFVVLAILSSTLDTIFRAMLYQYAKNGLVPAGLSPEVLQMAFKEKGS